MDITFTNPGVDSMIHQIMEFQKEGETAFWCDSLYHFFPQLDKYIKENGMGDEDMCAVSGCRHAVLWIWLR